MNKNELKHSLVVIFKWIVLEIAIIFGGLLLDIISKVIVQNTMYEGQSVTLIPKFLNICYVKNDKAAFGSDFGLGKIFGSTGVMIFFIILTFAAVGFFCFLLFKKPKKGMLYRISFSLIISGALGNLVDRLFLGYVRDFIQFEYFGLTIFGEKTFAIFNIADSCVVVGAIMLIVYFLFFDKSFKKEKQTVEAEKPNEEQSVDVAQNENANENAEDMIQVTGTQTQEESGESGETDKNG